MFSYWFAFACITFWSHSMSLFTRKPWNFRDVTLQNISSVEDLQILVLDYISLSNGQYHAILQILWYCIWHCWKQGKLLGNVLIVPRLYIHVLWNAFQESWSFDWYESTMEVALYLLHGAIACLLSSYTLKAYRRTISFEKSLETFNIFLERNHMPISWICSYNILSYSLDC